LQDEFLKLNQKKWGINLKLGWGIKLKLDKSTHFNSLGNDNEVKKKASELISRINGSILLTEGLSKPLKVSHVHRILDDGKREAFVSGTIACTLTFRGRTSVEVIEPNGTVKRINPFDQNQKWFMKSLQDESVAKVLRLYSPSELNWVNLYRILEVIEGDVGGLDKIVESGLTTGNKIELFKHTANSVGAIGDDARHGKEKTQPPPNPMSISKAKSLIKDISLKWLRSKEKQFKE